MIYIGTFSKVMFPALRMGYMVVPRALRGDSSTPSGRTISVRPASSRRALAQFIANGGFERHLRRAAKTLRERRAALLDGLRDAARDACEIDDSQAGMHLVVWLRDRDAARRARPDRARARSLGAGPASDRVPYYLDPPDRAGLLLGYGGAVGRRRINQRAMVRFGDAACDES